MSNQLTTKELAYNEGFEAGFNNWSPLICVWRECDPLTWDEGFVEGADLRLNEPAPEIAQ